MRGGVIGNTQDFGSCYPGSIPGPAATNQVLNFGVGRINENTMTFLKKAGASPPACFF